MVAELISYDGATFKTVGAVYASNAGPLAFDNKTNTGYGPYPPDVNSGAWVTFPTAQRVQEVRFTGHSGYPSSDGSPRKGAVYGSNDGGVTKVLLAKWNLDFVAPPGSYVLKLSPIAEYTSYGFHIDPSGSSSSVPFVGEIVLYGGESTRNTVGDVTNLSNAGFETVGEVYSGSDAAKAFDGNIATGYGPYPPSAASLAWTHFPGPAKLTGFTLTGNSAYPTAPSAPRTGSIYGSNNGGMTRSLIYSWNLPYVAPPGKYKVLLPDPVEYSSYGFYPNSNQSGVVPFIGEILMYNGPIPDSVSESPPPTWGALPI